MAINQQTQQQIKEIGARGGSVNTNGMRYEDKCLVDKLIQDGRQGK